MTAKSRALQQLPGWKLEDAKARLSELVRLAKEQGPQRVTVYGRDAVVVISADDYARVMPAGAQPSLHAMLSNSPLRDLDISPARESSPVREVEL